MRAIKGEIIDRQAEEIKGLLMQLVAFKEALRRSDDAAVESVAEIKRLFAYVVELTEKNVQIRDDLRVADKAADDAWAVIRGLRPRVEAYITAEQILELRGRRDR